jgi:hypothetical protein
VENLACGNGTDLTLRLSSLNAPALARRSASAASACMRVWAVVPTERIEEFVDQLRYGFLVVEPSDE